jgi:hypothetical protein
VLSTLQNHIVIVRDGTISFSLGVKYIFGGGEGGGWEIILNVYFIYIYIYIYILKNCFFWYHLRLGGARVPPRTTVVSPLVIVSVIPIFFYIRI